MALGLDLGRVRREAEIGPGDTLKSEIERRDVERMRGSGTA
jgi:hypothetical protein